SGPGPGEIALRRGAAVANGSVGRVVLPRRPWRVALLIVLGGGQDRQQESGRQAGDGGDVRMSHGHGLVSVIGSQSPTGLGSARPSIQIAPEALLFVRDVDAVRCDPKRVPRLQT